MTTGIVCEYHTLIHQWTKTRRWRRLHTVVITSYLFNLVTRVKITEKLRIYSFLRQDFDFRLSSDQA